MATLDAGLYGSIVDIANRTDPDGKISHIIKMLAQKNELLNDLLFRPTNDKTTHQSVRQNAEPAVERRRVNQGISPSKGGTYKVVDRCTAIEGQSKIDESYERSEGDNFQAYRESEDMMFVDVLNKRLTYDMFYASTASDPEDMSGLAQRYNSTSAEFGGQIISGGGVGSDNMSIYLIGHGEYGTHGIYPKGSQAGMVHKDHGKIHVTDSSNRTYWAWVSQFLWDYGLTVRDPRSVARIANIDSSALEYTVSSGADILELLTRAMDQTDVAGLGSVRWCFYAPKKAHQYIWHQAKNNASVELTLEESQTGGNAARRTNPVWLGIPIKRIDQLTETEATVS